MGPMKSEPIANNYHFCPRCGTPNAEPGQAPFQCEHCGFANYFGPVAAVGAIVTRGRGELLFIRRAREPGKGKWGLPGGFVDAGETGEQALFREIAEEIGLALTQASYLLTLPNQYDYRGVIAPVIDLFFLCQLDAPQMISPAAEEVDFFEWSIPTLEHLNNMAFLSNRLAIEYWMALNPG